ncbi:MAG: alcohol dehydrogenase catalytic domain-containing protein [Thermoleophilaceae bacterium]
MRAAVTQAVGTMRVVDVPEPPEPGPGEVLVGSMAVGICGSDYHFFSGHLTDAAGGGAEAFPKIQGHEVAGTVAAVGPDCRDELEAGTQVALWPLTACGHCYPCSVGRSNTCDNFQLIGIHVDGGLQQLLRMPQDHVYRTSETDPAVAAMAEPVSIAVRAVKRSRIEQGERMVILGAGPIGQSICLLARERGADVLVVDPQESRLRLSAEMQADTLVWEDRDQVVKAARDWSGGEGPPVVADATGVPDAVRAMVDMVASAGRVVQVGMSGDEVPLRVGSFTEKELDMLGVCCCGGGEFGDAVAAVERNRDTLRRLISHEFPLEEAPDALAFAMNNPSDVMKVVIRGA